MIADNLSECGQVAKQNNLLLLLLIHSVWLVFFLLMHGAGHDCPDLSITANDHNNQYVCVWDAKNWLAFTTDRGTMLHHQSNTDSSHTIIMSQLIHFCCIWVVRGSLWSWVFVFVFFLSPGFCWINIGFNVDVDTANSTAAATSYNRLAPAYTRTLIYWMDGWNGTDVNANAECIGPIKLD